MCLLLLSGFYTQLKGSPCGQSRLRPIPGECRSSSQWLWEATVGTYHLLLFGHEWP